MHVSNPSVANWKKTWDILGRNVGGGILEGINTSQSKYHRINDISMSKIYVKPLQFGYFLGWVSQIDKVLTIFDNKEGREGNAIWYLQKKTAHQ